MKHFAGNESEVDRMLADTIVDERALRELYLVPFEVAVREGGALGIMTAYNRLNGEYCADSTTLLTDILRDEWGFEGFVVTDWFAAAQTELATAAGLDLEMPGPGRAYGPALGRGSARRWGRRGRGRRGRAAPARGARSPRGSRRRSRPRAGVLGSDDARATWPLAREAAAAATVLLKNDGVLPLDGRAARAGSR